MKEVTSEKGKRQFELNIGGGEPFMMLPADMALAWDANYKQCVDGYNRDRLSFRYDARDNFKLLTELGCKALTPELACAPPRDNYQ